MKEARVTLQSPRSVQGFSFPLSTLSLYWHVGLQCTGYSIHTVTGHLAYWTIRLQDISATGQFAYRTFRLLDSLDSWAVRLLITSITENFNVLANLEKKGLYRT